VTLPGHTITVATGHGAPDHLENAVAGRLGTHVVAE
jgi:hypothetical protein